MQVARFFLVLVVILIVNIENGFSQSVNHWETAVFSENQWRYRVNESASPNGWNTVGFNDSGWLLGNGGFGYGDNDDITVTSNCLSVSVRKVFTITNKNDIAAALLHVDYDDAFIAWINGVEIARSSGLSGANVQWDTPSNTDREAVMYSGGTP